MINFDIDALRAMITGIELSSFAKASSRLGRSPSAISMQIKKLEQQAGRPLFQRSGRGLVTTEAGDVLAEYAKRILALNDEAAAGVGAVAADASVRIGMPQDFFDQVMPEVIRRFAIARPRVHVEVRAGRNFALDDEVRAGRLDAALAFFKPNQDAPGDLVASLPLHWFGSSDFQYEPDLPLPLVLFDHPCLFRSTALQVLDNSARRWRLVLTTPSLPGVWAAVRSGQGISVRTGFDVPDGLRDLSAELGTDQLPHIDLRLLASADLSPAAADLKSILRDVCEGLGFAGNSP